MQVYFISVFVDKHAKIICTGTARGRPGGKHAMDVCHRGPILQAMFERWKKKTHTQAQTKRDIATDFCFLF